MKQETTDCCIAGGGPAGMMLGYLLARAGRSVIVLEKHRDFFRDFRGDTIHPSTLQLMRELGLLDEFLKLPHQKVSKLEGQFGETPVIIGDFSSLDIPYIALMPQWDFLNFLASEGKKYPGFKLYMEATAEDLLRDGDTVTGLRVTTAEGPLEIRTKLTVACDGRHSTLRDKSGLEILDLGAPIDVLWFRLPRGSNGPKDLYARFDRGIGFIFIYRGDYWQCGIVIPKGGLESFKAKGLAALREQIVHLAPFAAGSVSAITSWDDIKLLSVQVNRLKRWHLPGLLLIGDAAHAMSPVGGVGVNLAVQDAVAAANALHAALAQGRPDEKILHAIQRRRQWPTAVTQSMQTFMQNFIFGVVLSARDELKPPLAMRLLTRFPALRVLPALLVGRGVRPEHVNIE